ncbi:unnamed protein product [Allacma fusca]|uniref:Uncharacterized protein n=1 Tax=Allacma fusca TaxID=39272 RepID=A0A8J2PGH5_9HEXA|nr:unnamed protein product [Allacma fusca]
MEWGGKSDVEKPILHNKTKADSWTTEIVNNHTNLNGVLKKSPTSVKEQMATFKFKKRCRLEWKSSYCHSETSVYNFGFG